MGIGPHGVRVLLIDGPNLIRRIHAATPDDGDAGEHAQATLRSTVASVGRALRDLDPTHGACVLEGHGESWRHRLHPDYKSGRPAPPAELAAALPAIVAALAEIGVACVEVAGFEADDVVASMAARVAARGGESVILSTDKSFCSLLGPGVRVRDHFGRRDLDGAYLRGRYEVDPEHLDTLFALVGEKSLSIPGVPSVGQRTAARLVAEHGDLERILEAAPEMAGRVGEALRAHADAARLSRRLFALRTDVEVGVNLKDLRIDRRG